MSDIKFDGIPVRVYQPLPNKCVQTETQDGTSFGNDDIGGNGGSGGGGGGGMVFYHGGGWAFLSVDDYHEHVLEMTEQLSIVIVSVEYEYCVALMKKYQLRILCLA